MERFGKGPEQRRAEPKVPDAEQLAYVDDSLSESRTGLGARFSEIKGRMAAVLLSVGIPAFEMPPARAVEPVPTELSEQIVMETLSSPVLEKIREQGFDVRVTLPIPENPSPPSYYLIHVGQLHEATFPGFDRLVAQGKVNDFHKRLYSIYEPLVTACKSPIFREAWVGEELSGQKEAEKTTTEVSDTIEKLMNASPQSIEDVLTLLTKVEEWRPKLPHFRRHPQAQVLADALQVAEERITAFTKSLPSDVKDDPRLEEITFRIRLLFGQSTISTLQGFSPQFNASSRLFYEGKVDLFPAENAKANEEAIALLAEAETAQGRVEAIIQEAKTLFENTPESKEIEEVYQDVHADSDLTDAEIATHNLRLEPLEVARKQFMQAHTTDTEEFKRLTIIVANADNAVHDARELAAYAQVEKFLNTYPDYGGSGTKCAVVEYGHDHTFAESAEVWNVRPDVKVSFGIIEIYDPTLGKSK